jgi:hypothetical protein
MWLYRSANRESYSLDRLLYSYKTEQYTFLVYFLVDTFIMFDASYWRLPLIEQKSCKMYLLRYSVHHILCTADLSMYDYYV